MQSKIGAGSPGPAIGAPAANDAAPLGSAEAFVRAGLPLAALVDLERAVAADPTDAAAWSTYGEALMEVGRAADAVSAFANAATLEPGVARHFRAWAEAQAVSGQREAALETFRRALERDPGSRAIHVALARLLGILGRGAEAVPHWREAMFLDAADVDGWLALGTHLVDQGDLPGGIDALQRGLRLDPDRAEAHVRLGRAWGAAADRDRAAQAFERALALDPADGAGARRDLAALRDRTPEGLTADYVRCLFDQYAPKFDADLLGPLDYRGPAAVAEALAEALGDPRGDLGVLDLGCGTGLLGPVLRPYARRLVGVDLSGAMLAQARARGVYDDLRAAEMIAALAPDGGASGAWDLIAFGDSLPYVGDLGPAFAAAAAALAPGGRVLATVEVDTEGGDGYRLRASRRFAHTPGHLELSAHAARFRVERLRRIALRREKTVPVMGLVGLFALT